jgi:hypothetical protein
VFAEYETCLIYAKVDIFRTCPRDQVFFHYQVLSPLSRKGKIDRGNWPPYEDGYGCFTSIISQSPIKQMHLLSCRSNRRVSNRCTHLSISGLPCVLKARGECKLVPALCNYARTLRSESIRTTWTHSGADGITQRYPNNPSVGVVIQGLQAPDSNAFGFCIFTRPPSGR